MKGEHPRVRATFLVAVMTAMAGCVSSGPSSGPVGAEFGELGVLEGLVVDESLAPVAGIVVDLREAGGASEATWNATTNAGGAFAFTGLSPASYLVSVSDPRYANATVDIAVVSGEIARVKLLLVGLPGEVPYSVVFIKSGIVGCNIPFIIESLTCTFVAPSNKDFRHEIPLGHELTIIEQTWQNPQESMTIWVERRHPPPGNETDRILIKIDAPVWRAELSPGQEFCCSTAEIPKVPVPPSNENFTLQLRSFYAGQYQKEINQTLGIVCITYYGSDACRGVGAALDFRFHQYVTSFANYRPAAPSEYTALPDG